MPNWVFNGLTIEGKPEQVNKLVEQMNKPFKVLHDNWDVDTKEYRKGYTLYPAPVFAFHNIYNHLEAGITDEEYVQQPARSELNVGDKDWWADTERLRLTDKSWYSWNITNWGVKWDVAVSSDDKHPDTYMEGPTENGENLVVYYNFNTAWSIPDEALTKLSFQYPTLLMTLSYEEETGWGGEREYLRGVCISESEYSWKCRECDNMEDDTPWCDECDSDICPECGYGEPMEEDKARCQTHNVELAEQKG